MQFIVAAFIMQIILVLRYYCILHRFMKQAAVMMMAASTAAIPNPMPM